LWCDPPTTLSSDIEVDSRHLVLTGGFKAPLPMVYQIACLIEASRDTVEEANIESVSVLFDTGWAGRYEAATYPVAGMRLRQESSDALESAAEDTPFRVGSDNELEPIYINEGKLTELGQWLKTRHVDQQPRRSGRRWSRRFRHRIRQVRRGR
jgi:hypothetical protein